MVLRRTGWRGRPGEIAQWSKCLHAVADWKGYTYYHRSLKAHYSTSLTPSNEITTRAGPPATHPPSEPLDDWFEHIGPPLMVEAQVHAITEQTEIIHTQLAEVGERLAIHAEKAALQARITIVPQKPVAAAVADRWDLSEPQERL